MTGVSIMDSMDMSLSKLRETLKDRCAAVHGVAERRTVLSEQQRTTHLYAIPQIEMNFSEI